MANRGPKLKIEQFNVNADRLVLGRSFEKCLERFERELRYNDCDPAAKPEIAQMALLIYAGADVEEIHETLPDPTKPETLPAAQWTSYLKSKTKLKQHFSPKLCNDFALYEMMTQWMKPGETVESFTLRLRDAAKVCDFTEWTADKMIKSLLIANMKDEELRLKLLQKERTLTQILEIARKKADAVERGKDYR